VTKLARDFLTCLVLGALAIALIWLFARGAAERFYGPPRPLAEMLKCDDNKGNTWDCDTLSHPHDDLSKYIIRNIPR
jgi:hypothetical protein